MTSTNVKRLFKDTITYWASHEDSFGGFSLSPPIVMKGRWEDRIERVTDSAGDELISRAVVLLDQKVEVDGYLYLGDSSSNRPAEEGAHRIRRVDRIASLTGSKTLWKAYL